MIFEGRLMTKSHRGERNMSLRAHDWNDSLLVYFTSIGHTNRHFALNFAIKALKMIVGVQLERE